MAGEASSESQIAPDFTLARMLRYFLSLGTVGLILGEHAPRDPLVEGRAERAMNHLFANDDETVRAMTSSVRQSVVRSAR